MSLGASFGSIYPTENVWNKGLPGDPECKITLLKYTIKSKSVLAVTVAIPGPYLCALK